MYTDDNLVRLKQAIHFFEISFLVLNALIIFVVNITKVKLKIDINIRFYLLIFLFLLPKISSHESFSK